MENLTVAIFHPPILTESMVDNYSTFKEFAKTGIAARGTFRTQVGPPRVSRHFLFLYHLQLAYKGNVPDGLA